MSAPCSTIATIPVVIIGAGPAGLMAAEQFAGSGIPVRIHDAMPSPGRKFLRAGIGGLNITHAEDSTVFTSRYSGSSMPAQCLREFDANAVREWAATLGVQTFVGSSGRVFPAGMKAAPLLRAWLQRLRVQGVELHTRQRWLGFSDPLSCSNSGGIHRHLFVGPDGHYEIAAHVTIFALGGGSWARLGSNGQWLEPLQRAGLACSPLQPSNCGFDYPWTLRLREQFAGYPLKSVALTIKVAGAEVFHQKGEALVSRAGVQGSLIYAASRLLRDEIKRQGKVQIFWDLMPARSEPQIAALLKAPRGRESLSNWLRKRLGLDGVKVSLLHELGDLQGLSAAQLSACLPSLLKALPQTLRTARPLDEAISTAGGVQLADLDTTLMSRTCHGVFFAGEMLDWDAPTGGYLLTACLATGRIAGQGALAWMRRAPGCCDSKTTQART